eukprot:940787-Prymnesium_polylepis.1
MPTPLVVKCERNTRCASGCCRSGRKLVGIRGLARLARLGVWHVWASGWTPGRAWTSYACGTDPLGVWQRLAASGRLDVWTSGTS